MKYCGNCGHELKDEDRKCPNCGTEIGQKTEQDFDHTSEFNVEDVKSNKLYAMLMYLTGIIGIIIALLVDKDSEYLKFHVRQIIKFTILETLLGLAAALLMFTFIVPIAAAICIVILFVIQIICFVQTLQGKSIEAPIVRSFKFLD